MGREVECWGELEQLALVVRQGVWTTGQLDNWTIGQLDNWQLESGAGAGSGQNDCGLLAAGARWSVLATGASWSDGGLHFKGVGDDVRFPNLTTGLFPNLQRNEPYP